jgi:GH24 family phage-related lysozyme (muramidase)
MADFTKAINIICRYEGYKEKAVEDPVTGKHPYTFGYGTQYYPDGSPVKSGHCVTKQKALEYLLYEIHLIEEELDKQNLKIDHSMKNALISFIHSIGWKPFLYSTIIDHIEGQRYHSAAEEMNRWIYNEKHRALGHLLERRKEETNLFMEEIDVTEVPFPGVLLLAANSYQAFPCQIEALIKLEKKINPYILTEFMNDYIDHSKKVSPEVELDTYYERSYGDFDR